jgi:hypothetical protein
MPKQPAFPGLRDAMKKKQTRRELFLAEMDAVVPWVRLLALIAPHYPKAGKKLRLKLQVQHRRPFGHRMLRWTDEASTSAARNVA